MATRNEKIGFTIAGLIIGGALRIGYNYNKAKTENREYGFWDGFGDFLFGGLIGAPVGRLAAAVLGSPNDTVNYKLLNKSKVVYAGITYEDRVDTRIQEHRSSGKKFTRAVYDQAKPRIEALEMEKGFITRINPKYNIQHNSR